MLLNKGDNMSEYYAVQRSGEYLEHYGVKGMKWGVRKAKAMWTSGNRSRAAKKLLRQYKKASNKLNKLNEKADLSKQRQKQIKYAKRAGVGIGIGMLGTAGTVGGAHIRNKLMGRYSNLIPDRAKQFFGKDLTNPNMNIRMHVGENHPNYKQVSQLNNQLDTVGKLKDAAGVAALGGYAYGGYAGARSLAAARRQTSKGHAKAVAKRDAWKKEMKSAFKGTKYQNLPEVKKSTRKKQRKYFTKNDFKDAAKAAGLSMLMGPAAVNYVGSRKTANETSANKRRKRT